MPEPTQPVKKSVREDLEAGLRESANSFLEALGERGGGTLRYLMRTEVHTFAFSVAATPSFRSFP